MLGPQAQPRVARKPLVAQHDVHLRVVEERVLVEVRRSDGEPTVVDDADLRVHVHRPPTRSRLIERAREEAPLVSAALGRIDEDSDLPARVVRAVVRMCGQQHDDAEVVARRLAQLAREDRDELRRPEELALEIDEALRRAQRAHVALGDGELSERQSLVYALGHGAHELRLHTARPRRGPVRLRRSVVGKLPPPLEEMR
jgi:hypothetical protein